MKKNDGEKVPRKSFLPFTFLMPLKIDPITSDQCFKNVQY
jgi:hypothetical protein